MKKGNTYTFKEINEFAKSKNYEISSFHAFESEVVGEAFIVIRKEENDITISFMLNGYFNNGFTYECVYSDLY